MLEDLIIPAQKVKIDDKTYSMEYDHKSYAVLESLTGKGIFKIKDLFLSENNLTIEESINLVCCACMKHHNSDEIELLRQYLLSNLGVLSVISEPVLLAFLRPLMPPEILEKFQAELKNEPSSKKKNKSTNG